MVTVVVQWWLQVLLSDPEILTCTNSHTLCLACRTEVESYMPLFERCEYQKDEVCVSDVAVMLRVPLLQQTTLMSNSPFT